MTSPADRAAVDEAMKRLANTTKPATGRRAKLRKVYQYNRVVVNKHVPGEKKVFVMQSGGGYAMHPESGAFVRIDKDRRSKKERKRAKRQARENAA